MKSPAFRHILLLVYRLLMIIGIFSLLRVLFFIFNYDHFKDYTISIFLYGILFDLSAIFILNMPLIFFHIIPLKIRDKKWYQNFLKTVFLVLNIPAIFFNCVDIKYFEFTLKRSTSDLFQLMTKGGDVFNLLPVLLVDYWYMVLIFILLCYIVWKFFPFYKVEDSKGSYNTTYWIRSIILFVFCSGVSVFIARGGWQLKPLSIRNAGKYVESSNIPLVLNTPFTIIKTFNENELEKKKYFSDKKLKKHFDPLTSNDKKPEIEKKPNIFLIILESFSSEVIGKYNKWQGYTPFLDSLMKTGMYFPNNYANGRKSIEAIPAIISSMPVLMDKPLISSSYIRNSFNSIPEMIKNKGYDSYFYHGGRNGTMGFNTYAKIAGFKKYYSMEEYKGPEAYDGNWGIWDEEFFAFTARSIDKKKEPFMACLFSLTSHHPFNIPEKYEGKFKEGTHPLHETIQYTDHALKKFFKRAKKMDWFDNTVFIITADHTSSLKRKKYSNSVGVYSVPLLIWHPKGKFKGKRKETAQHLDILPTVLDIVGYKKPFVSFGNTLLNDSVNEAVTYRSSVYQYIKGEFVLQFDGETTLGFYNKSKDKNLKNNLIHKNKLKVMKYENRLKSIIQQFKNRMIENKMKLKN